MESLNVNKYEKINKIHLNHEQTYNYFIDHIDYHMLGKTILDRVNFENGMFFTILPKNANIDRLYLFPYGGILPPISTVQLQHTESSKHFLTPNKIKNMDNELCKWIENFIARNPKNIAFVEDTSAAPTDPYLQKNEVDFFSYEQEVYYILSQTVDTKLINKTILLAGAVWHFLTIFTQKPENLSPNLTKENFEEMCDNLTFIVAGAYDGEGYIFWEKKP